MDSFEFTKFAAAVLAALLLMFGAKTAFEIAIPERSHSAHGGKGGYELPAPKEKAAKGGETATSAAAFSPAGVVALLGAAKPDNGAVVFKKCLACHTVEKGGANKVGPALYGVVGSAKASVAGFGYSDVLKAKGGAWTYEDLATFLNSPAGFAKGTKMSFSGVPDMNDLADLIAYLRSQSDKPLALPGQ